MWPFNTKKQDSKHFHDRVEKLEMTVKHLEREILEITVDQAAIRERLMKKIGDARRVNKDSSTDNDINQDRPGVIRWQS